MDNIAITFERNGKKYTGRFNSVHGAGQNTAIIFGCIFGLVIWLVIIYNIIASATRSKRIKTLLMFQARILKETTVKDGIPEEKIKELIDNLKRMHPEISI